MVLDHNVGRSKTRPEHRYAEGDHAAQRPVLFAEQHPTHHRTTNAEHQRADSEQTPTLQGRTWGLSCVSVGKALPVACLEEWVVGRVH